MKPSTQKQLDAYANDGQPPGDFIYAVVSNNLKEAYRTADDENLIDMQEIVSYMYNDMPAGCQGSPEKVRCWLELKRDEIRKERNHE